MAVAGLATGEVVKADGSKLHNGLGWAAWGDDAADAQSFLGCDWNGLKASSGQKAVEGRDAFKRYAQCLYRSSKRSDSKDNIDKTMRALSKKVEDSKDVEDDMESMGDDMVKASSCQEEWDEMKLTIRDPDFIFAFIDTLSKAVAAKCAETAFATSLNLATAGIAPLVLASASLVGKATSFACSSYVEKINIASQCVIDTFNRVSTHKRDKSQQEQLLAAQKLQEESVNSVAMGESLSSFQLGVDKAAQLVKENRGWISWARTCVAVGDFMQAPIKTLISTLTGTGKYCKNSGNFKNGQAEIKNNNEEQLKSECSGLKFEGKLPCRPDIKRTKEKWVRVRGRKKTRIPARSHVVCKKSSCSQATWAKKLECDRMSDQELNDPQKSLACMQARVDCDQ